MKKLLLVVPALSFGGLEKVAVATAEAFCQEYEVLLVYFYDRQPQIPTAVKSICLHVPYGTNPVAQANALLLRNRLLRKIKADFKPDVSLAFGEVASISNACTKQGELCLASVHGYTAVPQTWLKKRFTAHYFAKADSILCTCRRLGALFAQATGLPAEKMQTLYNPFDVTAIAAQTQAASPAHEEKTLLCMGRLDKNKNFSLAIEALALLHSEFPMLRLVLAGTGEEEAALQAQAQALGVAQQVCFAGVTDKPYEAMRTADVLLSTSYHEGFGNTLVEALCCGVPVVAADCLTGPREILAPNTPVEKTATEVEYAEYGVLVPPCTKSDTQAVRTQRAQQLAQAVATLLRDEKLVAQYRAKAMQGAQRFDIANYKRTLCHLMEVHNA